MSIYAPKSSDGKLGPSELPGESCSVLSWIIPNARPLVRQAPKPMYRVCPTPSQSDATANFQALAQALEEPTAKNLR